MLPVMPSELPANKPADSSAKQTTLGTGMAYCPGCSSVIDATATICPKCNADFTAKDGWRPVDSPPPATPGGTGQHWLLNVLTWTFVMGMGAGYGILAHTIFAQSYSHAPRGESGLMLLSFLIGIPLCIGSIAVYLLQRQKKAEQRRRAKEPAKQQQQMVFADNAAFFIAQSVKTNRGRNYAAKKNRLHRRNMRDLFDADIRQKKNERR